MGLSDFTEVADLGITIAGQILDCGLYHFRLPFSGFEHAHVVLGGEASSRWRKGYRTPCGRWRRSRATSQRQSLGGLPNLDADAREDLTKRYEAFCAHYGMTPTGNNPGVSHENGSIQSAHGPQESARRRPHAARIARPRRSPAWRGFVDDIVGRATSATQSALALNFV